MDKGKYIAVIEFDSVLCLTDIIHEFKNFTQSLLDQKIISSQSMVILEEHSHNG